MSGSALTAFNDFAEGTSSVKVSDAKHIINEAQEQTYSFGMLMGGDRGKKKLLQAGKDIRENVIFDTSGVTANHLPGATQNWENPQRLKRIEIDWRFTVTHMSWTRQEVMLNEAIRVGNSGERYLQFVNLRNEKETLMWTDKWNFMEAAVWKEPNVADMEASGGVDQHSIASFVNEDTNGLFNPRDGGTVFTTVEGIDPTATGFTKFVPAQRLYDNTIVNDAGHLVAQMDQMWKDVRFEMPPTMTEYFTKPKYNKQCIFTSRTGHTAIGIAIRQHTSEGFVNIAGGQDVSVPDPMYMGIPIKWVSQLDTATLYANVGTSDTESEATANLIGPRFYWINTEFLYPVFHTEMYFARDKVRNQFNDIDTFVMPVATWWNLICTSRQRQGIISPSCDLYTALY